MRMMARHGYSSGHEVGAIEFGLALLDPHVLRTGDGWQINGVHCRPLRNGLGHVTPRLVL